MLYYGKKGEGFIILEKPFLGIERGFWASIVPCALVCNFAGAQKEKCQIVEFHFAHHTLKETCGSLRWLP